LSRQRDRQWRGNGREGMQEKRVQGQGEERHRDQAGTDVATFGCAEVFFFSGVRLLLNMSLNGCVVCNCEGVRTDVGSDGGVLMLSLRL
jgi:hypothetical protein